MLFFSTQPKLFKYIHLHQIQTSFSSNGLFYSYRLNLDAFSFINAQAIYIFLSGIVSKTSIWHKRRFPFTVGIDLVFDFLAAAQKTLHDSTPSVETKDLV